MSQFNTNKESKPPLRISSLKWYNPPPVPNAVYSLKYLNEMAGYLTEQSIKNRSNNSLS